MVRTFQPEDKKPQEGGFIWGTAPHLPIEFDCVIYPRISTPGQRGNVSSELQLKEDGELWNMALRYGWKQAQVRHPKDDMELSGTLRMEDRPAFKQMLQWIINGEVRAVIAVNVDRLFRDKWGTEYSKFMEICEKYHVLVVTPDMVYNFTDAYCIKLFRDRCIQAWEYLEHQVYKRMLGAKDYLGETGRWAGGNLPPGYIVDRNKKSPTFRYFIRYMPWADILLRMYERYRELNDSLIALHREYDSLPFMFPDFEHWVDPEIIAKVRLEKVPGGYTMGLSSMYRVLINPFNIGWSVYRNKIFVDDAGIPVIAHEPIIPLERQDELFWHFFNQRSPYNVDGTKNERTRHPRRYTHLASPPCPALLKKVVKSGEPFCSIHVSPSSKETTPKKYNYTSRERMHGYAGNAKYMLSTSMVDAVFRQHLMRHLWETEDFTDVAKTEEATQGKNEAEIREAKAQIAACDSKIAKLLKRLTIVQEGDDDEATTALSDEEQKARDEALKKLIKSLKDELAKFTVEKNRQENRRKKLEEGTPDTYAAQMIEYHDILRAVGDRAREIYTIEELYDIVETFTSLVLLDTISPRVWKLTITWRDPAWGTEEIVSFREMGNPCHRWSEEEDALLSQTYENVPRQELSTLLPGRSWNAIQTRALRLGVKRAVEDREDVFPQDICLQDYEAIQKYGLSKGVQYVRLCL